MVQDMSTAYFGGLEPQHLSHGHCTLQFKRHPTSSFKFWVWSYQILNLLKGQLSLVSAYARCCWSN